MKEFSFWRLVEPVFFAGFRFGSLRAISCPSVRTAILDRGYSMPKGSVPSVSRIWPGLGRVVRGMHRNADSPFS